MNQIINQITNFFWNLDKKKFNQIIIGLLVGATLILSGVLYIQFRRTHHFKKEMAAINKNRTRVKEILEKNELIKLQRTRAEEILAQDKNFLLGQYIKEDLLKQLQLSSHLNSDSLTINALENLRAQGYEEVRMDFTLSTIDMKQLVDLLDKLEHNNRIKIQSLEITKSKQQPTLDKINVTLIISTLQHKAGAAEVFEAE